MSANPIQSLREGIEYVEAELRNIHVAADGRELNEDEQARWDAGVAYLDGGDDTKGARARLVDAESRAAAIDAMDAGKGDKGDQTLRDKSFSFQRDTKDAISQLVEDRSATSGKLADGLIRGLGERDIDDAQLRTVIKRHLTNADLDERQATEGREWARELLVRSTPVYTRAFFKYMTGRGMALTDEERAAISATTAANGGVLVPTHLDPTIILTNDGSANALRPISRVVTTIGNSNVWNGVSSAGVTASFGAPLTEVSDNSPTFAAPSVTVHKAQAFVQATVEAFDDIAALASDVTMMFADAKDRLEGVKHCVGAGDGSNEPFGIFTALDANTNVEIVSDTAATIALADLTEVRRSVGQRWRGRSTWVMNPVYADAIKALGTALSASYSTDITQANTDTLLGRPVVETDDAPETQTTTVKDNEIVFGDFSNYVIVDKPGSTSIEFIPHLFNTNANLPDGRRGWYMHWRTGADSVNDLAFRLLQDKTSA